MITYSVAHIEVGEVAVPLRSCKSAWQRTRVWPVRLLVQRSRAEMSQDARTRRRFRRPMVTQPARALVASSVTSPTSPPRSGGRDCCTTLRGTTAAAGHDVDRRKLDRATRRQDRRAAPREPQRLSGWTLGPSVGNGVAPDDAVDLPARSVPGDDDHPIIPAACVRRDALGRAIRPAHPHGRE